MSIKETNQMLNDLVAWINTYCHTYGRIDRVPLAPLAPRLVLSLGGTVS